MRIHYLHASKFGNGARVAERFRERSVERGAEVDVHHIRDVSPRRLAEADLYVFSSPGRMGRPIRGMRRFLKHLVLPVGTLYAILTTEMAPQPDPKTGEVPAEPSPHQRVRPIMRLMLEAAGLVGVAEDVVHVTGKEGPLEDGWEAIVDSFVTKVLSASELTGSH